MLKVSRGVVIILGLLLALVGLSSVALADAPPSPIVSGFDTISNVSLNGTPGTQLTVAPGADVVLTASWVDSHPTYCPGCIDFLAVGFQGSAAQAGCLENNGQNGSSGTNTVDLGAAPSTPGTYNILAEYGLQYYCAAGWWSPSSLNVYAFGPYSGTEGSATSLGGAYNSAPIIAQVIVGSPSVSTITTTWSYSANAGTDGTCTFTDASSLTTSIRCTDDGAYTLTLATNDGLNGPNDTVYSQTQLTENDAAISVGSISGLPTAPVAINTAVSTSVSFSDLGTVDAHAATWDWGDGNTSAGTVSETVGTGSGTVTGSHSYTQAGVYTVAVTVSDADNAAGTGSAMFQYVVVYDPSGGFVTGGGWINSPAGACKLTSDCQGATGKANFGFVSKYQKGATVPTGNTEFQFQAGNLDFHSSSYQWLVVNQNGANAQFKGTGTINDAGSYTFMIWATDGSPDTFRIQITDNNNGGATVYDNGVNQPIGGGSIVTHR